MDAETQQLIEALKQQINVLEHKVGTLENATGKHVCWCGPMGGNKCLICGTGINNPTTGDCGCPNGYCVCRH